MDGTITTPQGILIRDITEDIREVLEKFLQNRK